MEKKTKAIQIHCDDNVATLIDDLPSPGAVSILGGVGARDVIGTVSIQAGHKVALMRIAEGQPVMKFGIPIGRATRTIEPGQWVHLHNLISSHDERSGTLDLNTGVPTDSAYR